MCYDQGSYNGNGHDIQPSSSTAPLCAYVDDDNPMSLYSVVHKNRKLPKQQQQSSGDNSIDEIPMREQNFEDTESEYASELRRQTYRHKIGELSRLIWSKILFLLIDTCDVDQICNLLFVYFSRFPIF